MKQKNASVCLWENNMPEMNQEIQINVCVGNLSDSMLYIFPLKSSVFTLTRSTSTLTQVIPFTC